MEINPPLSLSEEGGVNSMKIFFSCHLGHMMSKAQVEWREANQSLLPVQSNSDTRNSS